MKNGRSNVKEKKPLAKLKPLIPLLLLAAAIFRFTQLDESKKRFLVNLLKQAPYLPGRYYA